MNPKELIERYKTWESTATLKEKIIVLVIVSFVLIFLFYQLYYSPKTEEIASLEKRLNRTKLEIIKYKGILPKYRILQQEVRQRQKFLATIQQMFPKASNVPEILKDISGFANRNNLEIVLFQPQKPIMKNYYKILPFKINFKGSFEDFLAFLNDISLFPRLVVVHDMDIRPVKDKISILTTLYTFEYTGRLTPKRKKKRR
ncbi:MAG: type 4a pilus biogenesis protein PilO [Thermodesulfobacteria bacterium]|nr:type 4a pilus biogenesis protein PilO [Thermodesulfobacteriota bacterium]